MSIDEIFVISALAIGIVLVMGGLYLYNRHKRLLNEKRAAEIMARWNERAERAKQAREKVRAELADAELQQKQDALRVAELYKPHYGVGALQNASASITHGGGGGGTTASGTGGSNPPIPRNLVGTGGTSPASQPTQNSTTQNSSMLSDVADMAIIANTFRHWNDTPTTRHEVERPTVTESPRYESSSSSSSDSSSSRSSYSSPSYSDDSSSSYSSSDSGFSPSYD